MLRLAIGLREEFAEDRAEGSLQAGDSSACLNAYLNI